MCENVIGEERHGESCQNATNQIEKLELVGPSSHDCKQGANDYETFNEGSTDVTEVEVGSERVMDSDIVNWKENFHAEDLDNSSVENYVDVAKSSDSFHEMFHKCIDESRDVLAADTSEMFQEAEIVTDLQELEMDSEEMKNDHENLPNQFKDGEFWHIC